MPEHGTRVLVVTDNAKAKGDALARELGEEVRAKRGTWAPPYLGLDEAIDAAYAAPKGPTVVADPSDNAGGGAASDNTNIIRRLIERGLSDACVGPLWDPVAVQFCHAAGVGDDAAAALRRQDRDHLGGADRRRSHDHRPQARRAPDPSASPRCRSATRPASASAASRSR